MNSMRIARWAFAIALVVGASISPARSQQKVPGAELREVLIKASLLSFNDANVTGNYAVFHAKLSKPFRDQFAPDKLAEIFREFRDKRIDFDIIAAKKPINTEEPQDQRQGHPVDQGLLRDHAEPRELRSRLHHVRRRVEADQGQCRREEAVAFMAAR